MGIRIPNIPARAAAATNQLIHSLASGLTGTITFSDFADWVLKTYTGFVQSGSGSGSSRSVQTELRELCFNVKSGPFGATGDGTTDDTTAINNALTAAANGGTVYFPAGTYLITSTLTIPGDGVTLVGEGYDSLINSNTANVNIVTATSRAGFRVANLRLNANGSSAGDDQGNCLQITTCTDFILENLWLENCSMAVHIQTNSQRGLIRNVHLKDFQGNRGITIEGSDYISVIGGTARLTTGTGIDAVLATHESGDRSTYISVTGMVMDLSGSNNGQGINFTQVDHGTISCNTIKSTSTGASGNVWSIVASGCTAVAITGNSVSGGASSGFSIAVTDSSTEVAVTGNVCTPAGNGISFSATKGSVTGNYVKNPTGVGLLAALGAIADVDLTISGNTIHTTTAGAQPDGIRIENMRGVVVSGNVIKSPDRFGLYVVDSADVVVTGNRIAKADSDGIQISGSPRTTVVGNEIFDCNEDNTANTSGIQLVGAGADDCVIVGNTIGNVGGTGNQAYGVYIGAATQTNTTVVGNNVRSNVTGGVNNAGTSSIIRANQGHVTENSGTGTINSGATTATVTHGLAVTPTAANISVVFTEQGTNDYGRWWISGISSTQFTVNVSADPGASNLDFSWQASVL